MQFQNRAVPSVGHRIWIPVETQLACSISKQVRNTTTRSTPTKRHKRFHYAGLPARLTFSPVYAPPETLQAFHGGATSIVADASVDIWAIGVMAFELVTHKRAFNALTWPKVDVMLAALGERAYDWESEVGTFKHVPQLRILSKVVHACLQRDPVSRPTAFQLLTMLNSLYDSTTQTGADGEQPKSKLESQE